MIRIYPESDDNGGCDVASEELWAVTENETQGMRL